LSTTNAILRMPNPHAKGAVPKPVTVDGVRYESIRAAAGALRLHPTTLARRLRDGWSLPEAIGRRPHRKRMPGRSLTYMGKIYPSIKALAAGIGVEASTLQARLSKGRSVVEAVEFAPRRVGHRKTIEFDGRTYCSSEALAAEYGLTWSVVSRRVKRGWTMPQALGVEPKPPRFRDFEGHARSQHWKEVQEIDGRRLPGASAGEYCLYVIRNRLTGKEYVGITTSPLAARLRGHFALARKGRKDHLHNAMRRYGRDGFEILLVRNDARDFAELQRQEVEEIERRGTIRNGYNSARGGALGTAREIRVGSVTFPSRGAAAAHFGIDVAVFNLRISRLGWTPEQAAEIEPRTRYARRRVTVLGRRYASLKAAAEALGKSYRRVADRVISKGWTVEQALDIAEPPATIIYTGKALKIGNRIYPSIAEAARAHGIDPDALSDRLRKGDDATDATERCITVRDRKHPARGV